jgi:glycosyltransferase involved in cell wall biosynthesis
LEVAEAIEKLWADPAAARAVSKRGTANVAKYSWDKAALQLVDAINHAAYASRRTAPMPNAELQGSKAASSV